MPQAPDNKIPFNVPWSAQWQGHPSPGPARAPGADQAGVAGAGRPQPQSKSQGQEAQALVQRAVEILENPSRPRPEDRRSGKLMAIAAALIALTLCMSLIGRAVHQHNIEAARPVITKAYFPTYLPAQDAAVSGRIYFKDRNGDVSHAKFEPIAGRFGPFEAAPPKWTSRTTGFLDFSVYIYCRSQREGLFRVTLFDRRGHSKSLMIGFRCG